MVHRLCAGLASAATAALAMLVAVPMAEAASYACPVKLGDATSEKLPDGWWRGTRDEVPIPGVDKVIGRLAGIWVISGKKGDEKQEAPAILVPDQPDGSYDLSAETDGLLISCIYVGSKDYYATALPDGTKACRQDGVFDPKTMTLSNGNMTCR